jgi:AcrR family transcriptional regulator
VGCDPSSLDGARRGIWRRGKDTTLRNHSGRLGDSTQNGLAPGEICVTISDMKKRAYHSPARAEQSQQTRRRIVEALTEQIYEVGLADFSVPMVAKRAGVATRTVYRYFPTREDLIAAVESYVDEVAPPPEPPAECENQVELVGELYRYFERNQRLITALHLTRTGQELNARMRSRRRRDDDHYTERFLGHIQDPGERRRRFAVGRVLFGSSAWRQLTGEMGLTNEEAIEIVQRTLAALAAMPEEPE